MRSAYHAIDVGGSVSPLRSRPRSVDGTRKEERRTQRAHEGEVPPDERRRNREHEGSQAEYGMHNSEVMSWCEPSDGNVSLAIPSQVGGDTTWLQVEFWRVGRSLNVLCCVMRRG